MSSTTSPASDSQRVGSPSSTPPTSSPRLASRSIRLAKEHHVLSVAIVLDVPREVCAERNESRADRSFGHHVLRNQHSQLRRSMKNLRREGFHQVYVLKGVDEIEAVDRRARAAVDRPS